MRDYAKIRPVFWTRGTGKKLRGDPEAQVVALYLMSAPLSHMTGLYYLPFPTLCHETGLSPEAAHRALGLLEEDGFARLDEDADLVFVPNMAREQIAESLKAGDNRVVGVMRHLQDFDKHPFCKGFAERYEGPFSLPRSPYEGPSEPPTQGPSGPAPPPFRSDLVRTISAPRGGSPGLTSSAAKQYSTSSARRIASARCACMRSSRALAASCSPATSTSRTSASP